MNRLTVATNIGSAQLKWTDNGEGRIDADAIRAFSWGHCHSFAYALHDITGWPIIGIGGYGKDEMTPGHFVVYDPRIDDFVDIAGPHALDRYSYLAHDNIKQFAPNELPKNYRTINRKMAEPFVRSVLKQLEQIPDAPDHRNAGRIPGLSKQYA